MAKPKKSQLTVQSLLNRHKIMILLSFTSSFTLTFSNTLRTSRDHFLSHPSSCLAGHLRPFRAVLHSSRSLTDAVVIPHDCYPISSHYLSTLLLQVVRGLPGLLLLSGAQVSAVLAKLLQSIRRMCPIHLHLLFSLSS